MPSKTTFVMLFIVLYSLFHVSWVRAATVADVVNQYPQITSTNNSPKEIQKIRFLINRLLLDGTHRPYPGGMYAEDMNKISFWKGEEIAFLSQLIPLLDQTTATNLKNFLKTEVTSYLLNQSYLNWIANKNSSLSEKLPMITWRTDFWQWKSTDLEIVYGLWAYAQYTGDWTTIQNNWSFISTIVSSQGGNLSKKMSGISNGYGYYRAPNSELSGKIGFARMAKKLYQLTNTSSFNSQYTSQLNTLNSSMDTILSDVMSASEFQSQLCSFDGATKCILGTTVNERDAMPYLAQFDMLTPEIARYVQSKFLSQVSAVITKEERDNPWWYLGGYNIYRKGVGEGYYQPPVLSNQIYQAKAMILNTPISELNTKIPAASEFAHMPIYWDVLNYHNLYSLIFRKETVTWTDTNTPPSVGPFPSSLPTVITKQGDGNNDGKVNGQDYIVWLTHFGMTTTEGTNAGDYNGDSNVNGLDYIVWLTHFGT